MKDLNNCCDESKCNNCAFRETLKEMFELETKLLKVGAKDV